jgi:hypothetical protein
MTLVKATLPSLVLALVACGPAPVGGGDAAPPDSSRGLVSGDGALSDLSARNSAPPDMALADLAMPDLAMAPPPDLTALAMPDSAMPDSAMPDSAMPDLAMPDLAMPDLAMPDLAIPDLEMPDLVMSPDLAMPDLEPACSASTGQNCGSCGGVVLCDGSCSITTPPNLGQACGDPACGGTVRCDGTCSTPANYGAVCGTFGTCHCYKTIDCNGMCVDDPSCFCCGAIPC